MTTQTTSKTINKIVYIGDEKAYNTGRVFCKIKYEPGKEGMNLSITGVIGPKSNGDCSGSCGQIHDSINIKHFADGWNAELLERFVSVWREYHLNDMNACTVEMKAAGWDKLAQTPINKYSYIITTESSDRRKALTTECVQNAVNGVTRDLTDEEKRLLRADTSVDIYAYELPETPEFLGPWLRKYNDPTSHKIEATTLGWVNHKDHPDGLLGKQLNGFGYGQSWYYHPVPDDVVAFLDSLPESKVMPPWV